MAKLTFGLTQSLDGYVDHQHFVPRPALFRHFLEHVRGLVGLLYGRRTYEIMRYWEEGHSDWGPRSATMQRCGATSQNGSCRAR